VAPAASGALLAASAETAAALDRSLWLGAGVTACVRVRRACAGLEAHLAQRLAQRGREVEGLASVSAPLSLGRLRLIPALGFGVGRLEREGAGGGLDPSRNREHGHDRRNGMRLDPMSIISGGSGSAVENGLRASAGLALSWPVLGALSLELGLSWDSSLAAFGAAADGKPISRHRMRAGLGFRYGRM
jgi:hypothetical protein